VALVPRRAKAKETMIDDDNDGTGAPESRDREARRLAYVRAKSERNHVTYDPKDWSIVFRPGGRSAHRAAKPLAWVLAVSVAAAYAATGPHARKWQRVLARVGSSEALLRLAISFLLVFRLARSATRFWEARQLAGGMIGTCRVLASTAAAHMVAAPAGDLDRLAKRASWPRGVSDEAAFVSTTCSPASALCRWLVAFPIATKNQLRRQRGDPRDLDGLLGTGEVDALLAAPNQPLYALDTMRCLVSAWADRAARAGTHADLVAQSFAILNRQLDTLSATYGGMERINNTPLPLVYAAHVRTYLLLYITLVPVVFAPTWRWATPPLTALVAWALLGIEAAAVECERPVHECANHIPLDSFCATIADNVAQTLRHSASMGRRLRAGGAP